MKQGQVAEGVAALTSAVANRIAQASNVSLGAVPSLPVQRARRPQIPPKGLLCGGVLPLIVFILIMRSMFGRRRNRRRWGGGVWEALILGQMLGGLGGRRGGWGGSRGFGGGFGGFGGSFGGGGRFGGGGGGASW